MPKHFILRNQFTKRGIQHEQAKKKDWPNAYSVVGSLSKFMVIQEEGGTKPSANKAFAIPKGIRTSDKRLVPRSKWPGKILPSEATLSGGGRTRGAKSGARNKPKPFLLREHDGVGVYVRTGKGRKLKRLYRLTRETLHIRGRHWLERPVMQVVKADLSNNFERALEDAMKTRR